MRLERTRGHGATMVRGGRKLASKIIEATVARSCGLSDIEKVYDQETLNAADDQFPTGIGLRDLLLLAARDNGYNGFVSTDPRGLLEAAFPGRSGPREIRAEGISTLSLPGIMSNVANKFLLQGFNAVESSWREVAAFGNARDFKQFFSYSFLMNAMFAKVGNAGELEHATASEVSYTNKVDTYGKMFAVTRQDIINDDLSALSQVPMRLGRGAAIGLNTVFWTEFLANLGTFYTSARGNVSTGAGSALTSAGLQAAQLAFSKQTDPNNDPLGISPAILLVPPELEITANELMTSLIINTGGASTVTKVPNRNVWANKYRTVMSRYLSNTNFTGNSTTAWWLIADPMDLPLIQVAFLYGRQEPVIESADADFSTLGIQFRGFWDVGVAKQEFRAAVRSAGS
jgi:phage major head subunit gpT-like protein